MDICKCTYTVPIKSLCINVYRNTHMVNKKREEFNKQNLFLYFGFVYFDYSFAHQWHYLKQLHELAPCVVKS